MKKLIDYLAKQIAEILSQLLVDQVLLVARLKVQPGDSLVFRTKRHLHPEAFYHLRDSIDQIFPGVKAIILEEDMTLDAVLEQTRDE